MKKIICRTLFSLTFSSLLLFSSCSQTETIEEVGINQKTEEIVLNLTAPESLATKASLDHKLRFTAKLYEDRYDNTNGKGTVWLETKQAVASLNGTSTIVFSVEPGTYSVLLFADYIPETTQPDANGMYADQYYDTSSNLEYIKMKAFTDEDNNYIPQNCINNDNYDCFYAYTGVINKTEEKVEKDVKLTRATAKVRFVSTTPVSSPVSEITFDHFYCFNNFGSFSESVTCDKRDNAMKLSNVKLNGISNTANQELFYFYTLAGRQSSDLGQIEFDLKLTDGTTRHFNIQGGNINVIKNHVTTVRNSFLSDPNSSSQKGDIILNLSTDETWDDEIIIQ